MNAGNRAVWLAGAALAVAVVALIVALTAAGGGDSPRTAAGSAGATPNPTSTPTAGNNAPEEPSALATGPVSGGDPTTPRATGSATASADAVTCPAATVEVGDAASLADALDNAVPGDVIHLADGRYEDKFTAEAAGTAEKPIWVCEATGGDVTGLAEALAYDDRIGGRFLKPGLGFGGGCLPKDIRAFAHRAEELGVGQAVGFLREVDDIDKRRRARTVDLVRELAGGDLTGVRVTALGAAFKPNSDDIRDAPALDVASTLHRLGAHVTVVDPAATENARRGHPQLDYGTDAISAAAGADVVVLLTEWNEFRQIAPEVMGAVVNHRRIVDGRHALDPARWRAAGWEYRALGRP